MERAQASEAARRRPRGPSKDAIALLKADHREVTGWFAQFGKAKSKSRKQALAEKICRALKVHTKVEEEIFYAKVKVLAEMIKHHVKEEERPGGMFSEARKSNMDLDDLGERLKVRKQQLQSNANTWGMRENTAGMLVV
jgi:hypothetical protein